MTLGTGIAIAAIWCAVAVIGWHDPRSGALVALPAVGATLVVCIYR